MSRIFLDGGDPNETRDILALLPSLAGQTTNPTLVAKNPEAQRCLVGEEKCTAEDILSLYKSIVREISNLLPQGSVSVEVYADKSTTADEMFAQAKEMWGWIPNAHIKYPTTKAGLEAAEHSIQAGMRGNMTLVFSQEQAAAVHSATRGAKKGDVYVSPFIGRLDDIGENGMDLIKNIRRMYDEVGSHVEVLAASIRSTDHFLASLSYGADIITAPGKAIREWIEAGKLNGAEYLYDPKNLKAISYRNIDLSKKWQDFDIAHPLTDKGIERFASDWNALIQ